MRIISDLLTIIGVQEWERSFRINFNLKYEFKLRMSSTINPHKILGTDLTVQNHRTGIKSCLDSGLRIKALVLSSAKTNLFFNHHL